MQRRLSPFVLAASGAVLPLRPQFAALAGVKLSLIKGALK